MTSKNLIRNFSIIAHIDHGKSTLADRLILTTGAVELRKFRDQILDTMDIERERGITIKAQAIRLYYKYKDGNNYELNLIDTPGHIDFNYEVSRSLAACEGALLLVDATQGIEAQTLTNFYLALDSKLQIIPIINKIDLPAAEIENVKHQIMELGFNENEILLASAKTGSGVTDILDRIVELIPAPIVEESKDLKALIFDAKYDNYRGVIVYVKLISGEISVGKKIKLMAVNSVYEVLETGYFGAGEFIKCDKLTAGEVGYIIAGIKFIKNVHIGDTVIDVENENAIPLPGYKNVKPVVFSSFYPIDTADYPVLRDSLEKLKLNDNSLVFTPESSPALGAGFKCGFLGLLHLEIIKERLERESEISILVTIPGVEYKVYLKEGTILNLISAMDYPDPATIQEIHEPYIKVNIIVLDDYLGNVLKLCEEYRGIHEKMEYIDSKKVILKYELPLAEVIVDFYDKLKSYTKGYASFDYELSGYRKSDLVKVDILINRELIEPLSMIVHTSKAFEKSKNLVEKLKELIPKQQFAIPVQAAIGSRVIARETIKALRKDVLAKLYGGDVTRKQKLLKKQKEGKKKMKNFGKVSIPQEAFTAILKI